MLNIAELGFQKKSVMFILMIQLFWKLYLKTVTKWVNKNELTKNESEWRWS